MMRIGVVSTYPPIECGIATYTGYLTDSLLAQGNELHIASQFGGSGEKVYPVFDSDDPDLAEKVFRIMVKFTPDVVHIQHEYGLFGSPEGLNCIPLVYRFKLARIPVVITLHTVYEHISEGKRIVLDALLRGVNGIIVHQEYQKETILREVGQFDNIRVIPHGARELERVPDAKRKMGLDKDMKVILLCGYFRRTKGMDRIIRIFPEIVKKVENAVLVIASKLRREEHQDYRDELLRIAENSPVAEKIHILKGGIPQDVFDTVVSAADVIPLPYQKGAQSGILAHCLAFGTPVVVSPAVRSLRETVAEANCGFVAENDDEFVECIAGILTDDNLRKQLSKNAMGYVKNTRSWKLIAEKTMEFYEELTETPHVRVRYV